MPVSPSLAPAQQHIIRNELKLQFIWELFAITPFHIATEHCDIQFVFTKPCFPNQTFMRLWKFSSFFFTLYHDGSFHVDRKPLYFTQYYHRIAIFYWYLCDLDEHFIKPWIQDDRKMFQAICTLCTTTLYYIYIVKIYI